MQMIVHLSCFFVVLVFLMTKNYLQVTQLDLHRQFHGLGAGVIEEVRVQRDKGFGFVRYSTHAEAALAIQMGNARILCGKPIKVISIVLFYVHAMLLFEWTCRGSPFFFL